MGKVTGNPSSRYLVTQDNGNQYYTNSVGSRWGNAWEAHDVQGQAAYNRAARAGLVDPVMDATPVWRRDEMVVDQTEEPMEPTVTVDTPEVTVEPQKKKAAAPQRRPAASNGITGKYGFAGDIQRNWRGTRKVINPDVLAKLKETGFTGTTAKEAQEYMNKQFGNVGMFGYKVATDDAWGSQSQRAFDQFYKSWKEHQSIKPDELKEEEVVEQPVDKPDFGYLSQGTYALDNAKSLKTNGIKDWSSLVNYAGKNKGSDFTTLLSGYFGTDDVSQWDRKKLETDAKIHGGYHGQDRAQLQGFLAGLQKKNNDQYYAKQAAYQQKIEDPNIQRQLGMQKFMMGNAGAGTLGNQPGFNGNYDAGPDGLV